MKKHIVILGAGPCGLGALWQLQKDGDIDVRLYEQSDHAGGLSSSYIDAKGFIWDMGGHVMGTKNKAFIDVMHSLYTDRLERYRRSAWVRVGSTMIPYPIQYHIDKLPQEKNIPTRRDTTSYSRDFSFYWWILRSFGKELANTFFLPFNRKLWKYPLNKMSTVWIKEKIPQYTKSQNRSQWGANASFYYPRRGGIGSVWNRIAGGLKPYISYNKRVVAIDVNAHTITFSDHDQATYDKLISTIPLPTIASLVQGIVLRQASQLPYVGVAVVGVGMRGTPPDALGQCHWIYIPDATIPYFRVSVYSNYGFGNAPKGTWSLLFETSIDSKTTVDKKKIIEMTITHAKSQGLIPMGSEIISTFFHYEPFGYPIPTLNRDDIISKVNTQLEKYGIYSRGRFGSWRYEEGNMDDAWMQGVMLAKKL